MRILLTGSSGVVGSYVLQYLLKEGHSVIAVDQVPLPQTTLSSLRNTYSNLDDMLNIHVVDLSSIPQVQSLFAKYETPEKRIEGLIHLAAIPSPERHDPLHVHNLNTSISYNILYTSAAYGIRRLVQASSVNFTGLSYTRKGMQKFDELPITEEEACHAEDPYGLSKQICEIQAISLCRLFPVRIASLRFHHVVETLEEALRYTREEDLWAWTSSLSAAQACLLGLTSDGWEGHEAFNIVADEIVWNKELPNGGNATSDVEPSEITSLELLNNSQWIKGGRIGKVNKEYREGKGNQRKGFWDCTKAKRLLGWEHNV